MKRKISRRPWIEGGAIVGMMIDGQRYRFLKAGLYVSKRTGNAFDVAWYLTNCADCETQIEVSVLVDAVKFYASRRCADCARPGLAPRVQERVYEPEEA
jgi:hypothetical protein